MNKAIWQVIEDARFVQGPEVRQFEREFADYLGAHHCITLNSGTDALILGIRALDLKNGDEVIVPANTFIATALGASENGLKPVFVDVDDEDFGMDLVDLKRKITTRTKAVIPVHLFGQPEKLDEIQRIIRKSGKKIVLVEDACQAHGAKYRKRKVGTFGMFSTFSFYPGKNLGAYGDAGAIATNNGRLAEKVRKLAEYGQKKRYYHESAGRNSRLDTIQASVLLEKLKYLDRWNERRRLAARGYTELLHKHVPSIKTPAVFEERESVYHLYVIRTRRRDRLLRHLNENGIQALIHYPIPLHLQKTYRYLGYKQGDLPKAEKIASQILSLPMFPELTVQQRSYVVSSIKLFYKKN